MAATYFSERSAVLACTTDSQTCLFERVSLALLSKIYIYFLMKNNFIIKHFMNNLLLEIFGYLCHYRNITLL